MKFIDLTGLEFNNFKVLHRSEDYIQSNGRRRAKWVCLCNCGNEFEALGDNIKKKDRSDVMACQECANKNRAVHNRVNVVGNKYNRLKILESVYDEGKTMAICLCDCGNVCKVSQADVVCGHTKSCGCLQSEMVTIANTKDWTGCVSEYGVVFISPAYKNESGQWMWNCKCGVCGNNFVALSAKINNGHITSCGCNIQSKGEQYVKYVLDEMNISYIPQYTFNDCIYRLPLRFDFAIFNNSKLLYLIEYDGKQHYEPVDYFGGQDGFELTKKRDSIKNEYCLKNNIPLIRFNYLMDNDDIKNEIIKIMQPYRLQGDVGNNIAEVV